MKLLLSVVCFLLLICACSSGERQNTKIPENPIDSFDSALPHGQQLMGTELSDEDKIKLAQANGKKAESLTLDSLLHLIKTDTSGLVLYYFWNLDCQTCITSIDQLKKLQYEVFNDTDFKVVYINTDGLYPEMVNSLIREKEMIDQVFTVAMDAIPNWASKLQNGWSGQLPAMLIVNNEDGTRLFYQREFSFEELQTVLFPLTL